ncbi:unnamed protein product [Darwinula stevensoni]|uniref:Uncharacterized protein n=1 Tax=Darwinula stevensoni TaxID=69355 RepID=A0A7R9FRM9_9CRUS|nr:unnamed protein product [Darwinula stevensoni]CAG0902058.1 unnamed protein product [Darwinula stevensoni]
METGNHACVALAQAGVVLQLPWSTAVGFMYLLGFPLICNSPASVASQLRLGFISKPLVSSHCEGAEAEWRDVEEQEAFHGANIDFKRLYHLQLRKLQLLQSCLHCQSAEWT